MFGRGMDSSVTMSRKRILIAAACIGVVFSFWLLTVRGSRECPLAIRFVGLTNHAGERCAAFVVTNRSAMAQQFTALAEPKVNGSWPSYAVGTHLPHRGPYDVSARGSHELYTPIPRDGATIRMSIACSEPWTKGEERRWACAAWFHDHNMSAIGRLISKGKPGHLIWSEEVRAGPLDLNH